jgi:hypothetical protein
MDDDQFRELLQRKFWITNREKLMDQPQGVSETHGQIPGTNPMEETYGSIPGDGFLWCLTCMMGNVNGVIARSISATRSGIKWKTSQAKIDAAIERIMRRPEGGKGKWDATKF